ncbi:MAG: 30S ribosomal protein S13 [Promethearchaeota archaeon]
MTQESSSISSIPTKIRPVIRIAKTDLDGTKKVPYALTTIRGINIRLAHIIVRTAQVDPDQRLGTLTEAEAKRIEQVLQNPKKHEIPAWTLNRQRDAVTGEDKHVFGTNILLSQKEDIDRMMRSKSWKGIRHSLGLKVRGQKTRTSGRKGITVGVKRKTLKA